jgi:hypothetical protein
MSVQFVSFYSSDVKPPYFQGSLGNNITDLMNAISSAGYETRVLIDQMIIQGMLDSTKVLVFCDNAPSEEACAVIKEWLGPGKGIITFDSAASFLCYAGILPPESAGSGGEDTYWDYNGSGNGIVVNTSHPVTEGYNAGSSIGGESGDAEYTDMMMEETSIGAQYFPLVGDTASGPERGMVVAYEGSLGRVVHFWDNTNWGNTDIQQMILNAVSWIYYSTETIIARDDLYHVSVAMDLLCNGDSFDGIEQIDWDSYWLWCDWCSSFSCEPDFDEEDEITDHIYDVHDRDLVNYKQDDYRNTNSWLVVSKFTGERIVAVPIYTYYIYGRDGDDVESGNFRCRFCTFESDDEEVMFSHVATHTEEEICEVLTSYQE